MLSYSLCHSSVTEWKATRLRRLYTPSPLTCTSAHCVCLCWLFRMNSYSCLPSACLPPLKHIQTKHRHQMLAYQFKDTHRCLHTNTCTQTQTPRSREQKALRSSNTITLWLSALDSKSGSVNVLLCVYRLSVRLSQLGFIGLICVCTCLKQFEGIRV